MRILFALPGLHRIDRGAEVALLSVANGLARRGHNITVYGMGEPRLGAPYTYEKVGGIQRESFEKFPMFPPFRNDTVYEEFTFSLAVLRRFRPSEFDLTVGCSFPFLNCFLRRPILSGKRPAHVFVTQNGDHPARTTNREFQFFGCDGLVCINPDFHSANKEKWFCSLIPNGVDLEKFSSGVRSRQQFGLPENARIVLMVSALIESKRVYQAIKDVAAVKDAVLVVAGDGPERSGILQLAAQHLPKRFVNLNLPPEKMPDLYNSADVFLHMSLAESFGNVFIEAQACGLSVVAHDSPRHRWVCGDTATLIDTETTGMVTTTLESILRRNSKPRRVPDLRKYDWSVITKQYEDFFQTVLLKRNTVAN